MDSEDKALLATLFVVLFLIVVLSFTLAPIWLMAFLVLLGVIAFAVFKGKKEGTLLPTQDPGRRVNASAGAAGQADNASVVASSPAAFASVRNLRRQPVNVQGTLLPTQDQAHRVNASAGAPGQADNASVVASSPAAVASVRNLRRQPVNEQGTLLPTQDQARRGNASAGAPGQADNASVVASSPAAVASVNEQGTLLPTQDQAHRVNASAGAPGQADNASVVALSPAAVASVNVQGTLLPTQDQAHRVNASAGAPGQADNASVVASSPAAVASVRNLRRQPVNEQVECVSSSIHDPLLSAPSDPVGTSEASSLRLQFVTKLPEIIFTKSQIKAVGGTPMMIELVNGRTNERITSGCLSSIKIEIVVLDGKFGLDKGEDWTEEEFNGKITLGRGRPLIIGELAVVLQGGIGCLHNLSIPHHSRRKASKKFRLGARAAQQDSVETRIREARSEAFTVQSFRGEKHHPPNLSDKVWRLVEVARDVRRRMASKGIITVQDFLQRYEVDASSLREILGKETSNDSWEEMVRRASTYVIDDNKMYAYASKKGSITFNSVMKVAQATLNGNTYKSVDELTDSQKIVVQELKWKAYHHKKKWVALDAQPSIAPPSAPTNLPA